MNSVESNNTNCASQPPITILWATQSGRAKACARRTIRLLRSQHGYSGDIGGMCSFDDFGFDNLLSLGRHRTSSDNGSNGIALMFASTTGDAEQCSTIQNTWNSLLSKSLAPQTTLPSLRFALFALGDRAYGPDAFCAAGRKLAARLVQLGGGIACPLGYGDDGSPNGGVFADLDVWLVEHLFPALERCGVVNPSAENESINVRNICLPSVQDLPYIVEMDNTSTGESDASDSGLRNASLEWQHCEYRQFYDKYFQHSRPPTAYQYNNYCQRMSRQTIASNPLNSSKTPLLGRVTINKRITSPEWMQDTRHLRIHVKQPMDANAAAAKDKQQPRPQTQQLPYQAGDIATILPSNPAHLVSRFLSVLPPSIQSIADTPICIQRRKRNSRSNAQASSLNHPWPERCTLRGLLTHCADIQSLPEREDLYALSIYCNENHPQGKDQRDKLISLSETSGAALYGDYIIREKRNWIDLFYDFDAVRWEGCRTDGDGALMTISHLLTILPSLAPRHFSIASSPSYVTRQSADWRRSDVGFDLELCVAIVEGKTPLGRSYAGFCSTYLSSIIPRENNCDDGNDPFEGPDIVRLWIHPGSFSKLPLDTFNEEVTSPRFFNTPIMCIGAGTGIAPLRSLIMEREAARLAQVGNATFARTNWITDGCIGNNQNGEKDNILVFGCRKKSMDFYYESDWNGLIENQSLRLIIAFSRDQTHKLYVQRALREADGGSGALITHHILARNGAVYIAGGSKMARAVREEIVEALGSVLEGGEGDAKKFLNKLKRKGMFSIEAWS